MLFNYLQRALQHLNSHTPKLSSADLALLIYTPLNLGEVTESSLKGAWQQWLTPVQLGFANFSISVGSSSLSSQCQSICRLSAGNWLEAGRGCFVVLLL